VSVRAAEPWIAVPEPGLTPEALVERAAAFRTRLREEQRATEERGRYSDELHEEFRRAGFYRLLQPKRFGGYEFDVGTHFRVVREISRGCPSTGWMLGVAAGHALVMGSYFPAEVQADVFGPDGEFLAASMAAPTGTATAHADGWRIEGTWRYCSGAPIANYFLPAVLVRREGERDVVGVAVVPREQWRVLDDWNGFLGLRGSGSNAIAVDGAIVPDAYVVPMDMLDADVAGGTPGSALHGNPLYGGRALTFFHGELIATMVGAARAALDEYEEIIRTRPGRFAPYGPRYESAEFQRPFGLALGMTEAAEAVMEVAADRFMAYSRRGFEGGEPFTLQEDMRGLAMLEHAGRLLWEAGELLFRTAGSSSSRAGERLQMYYRDLSVYRQHMSAQYETIAERLAKLELGLLSTISRTAD
jgi:3-hydroxy-9,10-secoandrosta-1,3,5(10)-triene-9,17-dione monooxygenase